MTDEQEFRGGVNLVRRRGDAVHRPGSPAAPSIHRLLQHLHDQGFHGAPEPRGFDEQGNEVLSYLDGQVPTPLTPELRGHDLLCSAARLLRQLHDASATFPLHPDDRWLLPARHPVEVTCHGDAAPYNCVVKDGQVVGLIDFDTAHPGPRDWDVAYAIYRFAPLQGPANPESFGTPSEQAQRAVAFCRAYGTGVGAGVVDVVADRLQALIDFMRAQAGQGNEAFRRHLAAGHAELYEADITYLRDHRDTFHAAFTAG